MLHVVALVASVALGSAGAIVSCWQILLGDVRPNLVSRAVWTSATFLGLAGAVADGAGWGAFPLGVLAVGSAAVTGAAVVRRSSWHIDRVDSACGLLAVGGLVLWQAGLGPGVAVVAAVAADSLAAVPTYRHAWRRPVEESWIFYACSGAAAAVGLWSLEAWTVATVAFNLYLVVLCGSLVAVILGRRSATAHSVEGSAVDGPVDRGAASAADDPEA